MWRFDNKQWMKLFRVGLQPHSELVGVGDCNHSFVHEDIGREVVAIQRIPGGQMAAGQKCRQRS